MTIILDHLPFYREVFALPKMLEEPVLSIGLPTIEGKHIPKDFNFNTLTEYLKHGGCIDVKTLDYFDPEADIKFDLNKKLATRHHNKYSTLIDIGTIEHIFDTKQCLENYCRAVKTGGLLMIMTCVNGFYGHGFHVFNPQALKEALKLNNFEIIYEKYTSSTGYEITNPSIKKNVILWLVAKKRGKIGRFKIPQQMSWGDHYSNVMKSRLDNKMTTSERFYFLKRIKKKLIHMLPKSIFNKYYGRI